ncbi:MAG: type II secretion system protein [Verrucomicrobiota bacterium]
MKTTTIQSWKVGRAVPCPPSGIRAGANVTPPSCGGQRTARPTFAGGFTLVELLVVITVIGIIAAMVAGLSGLAARKKHDAVVTAEKNRYVLFISSYKSILGFFPPDNAANVNYAPGTPQYEQSTSMNSLIYELTGAPMTNNTSFLPYDGSPPIPGSVFSNFCGRGGIANSLPDEIHVLFQPLPSPKDYMTNSLGLKQLIVPLPLTGALNNFWHYDCSNPNRHNSSGFDLWAEYSAGSDTTGAPIIVTNGNWNLP